MKTSTQPSQPGQTPQTTPCEPSPHTPCHITITPSGAAAHIILTGAATLQNLAPIWPEAIRAARQHQSITVNLAGIRAMDGAAAALLLDLKRHAKTAFSIEGLPEQFAPLLAPFSDREMPATLSPARRKQNSIAQLGQLALAFAQDLREQISFLGSLLTLFATAIRRPRLVRWGDVLDNMHKAGVDAVPIVGLIGVLMGMILAFQSAPPLRQFGVDIFVVNLVALAMLRELGVIMTAIVLAGRSGSAFAAEIGTMKVNEEVNALLTMGLDPARFLVLPRVLAGILVMPMLTIYASLAGIAGGLFVVLTFGYPWAAVWGQLTSSADLSDVATGIVKSFVFGFLVSAAGCLRGLQTGLGALSVGKSTTRSVVASIVLIILADMVFAAVFYTVGL